MCDLVNYSKWNNGQCMAKSKSTNKQCNHKIKKKNTDFCFMHEKNSSYCDDSLVKIRNIDIKNIKQSTTIDMKKLNKELINYVLDVKINDINLIIKYNNNKNDENFKHNLLNMYESWHDVKLEHQIELDNEYWDINILIYHFTQQLNMVNMENPYPVFPNNPFNRSPFTPIALDVLKNRIKFLNIPLNITLKMFLQQPYSYLVNLYNQAITDKDKMSYGLLKLFTDYFRFKIINNKNSQNLYNGYWVKKNIPLNEFEKLYNQWKLAPTQLDSDGRIVMNNERLRIKILLDNCPDDFCDFMNKNLVELLD